jgi:hypothetical protein
LVNKLFESEKKAAHLDMATGKSDKKYDKLLKKLKDAEN